MRFDDRFLDEIKSRLRLSDVIGKTVKLRRQGREFVGLSPFNKEKSPSFFVNDDKGFFHDFSSGKHGDLIGFLQETERLTFVEAVERLAGEAGLPLPEQSGEVQVQERRRRSLEEWLDMAARWFEGELRRASGGAARDYLARRGLPEAEWSRFRLGYSPDGRSALKDYLISKGAMPRELAAAGVLIVPEDGSETYDRFRDRIIFPISDVRGRVISFGGRAMNPRARAKYLNGPETEIFDKSRVLYGFSEARRLVRAGDDTASLVVVEGYMDVIACQRASVAAVATMGTSLTEAQIELLWRVHPEPTLCFDGDRAGIQAVSRAIDRALPLIKSGRSFKFAFLEGGKDPDDVMRQRGEVVLRHQLSSVTQFSEALFQRECDREPHDTPERRAGLKGRLRRIAASIQDRDVAEQYRTDLFDRFYKLFRRQTYSGSTKPYDVVDGLRRSFGRSLPEILQDRIRCFNAAVAIGAVENPQWLAPFLEKFAEIGFGDKRLAPIVQPVLDAIQEENSSSDLVLKNVKSDGVQHHLDNAYKYACEVNSFPFVGSSDTSSKTRDQWTACFKMLMELEATDRELKERRAAFEARAEVIDANALIKRGAWLRKHQHELTAIISSGVLWGAAPPDTRVAIH